MKITNILKTILILALVYVTILPEQSEAIPAFARRYKVSCNTCHSVFPRLKAYGDEFAGNGFIIPEKETKRDYVTAGDDMLWLNKDFPIAARMEMFAAHDQGKTVENDLQIPWGIKLLSGGTLYKNIGYYFYFYLSERGEVAGIEDAYIHFNNIFETNLDIMVGQFQTSDPLMKRELRLTYEDYQIYRERIGLSNINLTYDRGVMIVYGVEQTSTDLIAMVVNGNGKPEAVTSKLDKDNYKNYGFRVNQPVGDLFTIGGFYYTGKERVRAITNFINEVTYYGPDFTFGLDFVEITGQYLKRKDTSPESIETDGLIAEVLLAPDIEKSNYHFTVLYNLVDSDFYKYETATLNYSYQLARNLRFLSEYTRDLDNGKNRVVIGIIGAF